VAVARPVLLALRALGLGDALTALPALRALAEAFPEHRRLVAMPRPLEPLLGMARLPFELVPAAGLGPLPVARPAVAVAVNLHGQGPRSHRLLGAVRPGRLVAFSNPLAGAPDGPHWLAREHEVARWCRLLIESGIPADATRLGIEAPPAGPLSRRGATVIHPGAASAARRWPWRRWAEIARRERAAGREVLLTGGAGEAPLAFAVARAAGLPAGAVVAGRTGLVELAGVVGAAGRVACGDTGVAHLATALGRPSVVLFGPVPPQEWGPFQALGGPHRALWAGRRGDPHAPEPDPGLLRITVDEVSAALADVA
jgi:ADP-heptose:LPS heptosyltransferase